MRVSINVENARNTPLEVVVFLLKSTSLLRLGLRLVLIGLTELKSKSPVMKGLL